MIMDFNGIVIIDAYSLLFYSTDTVFHDLVIGMGRQEIQGDFMIYLPVIKHGN